MEQPMNKKNGSSSKEESAPKKKSAAKKKSPKMLRLLKKDRWIHWPIAIPCVVCYVTSLILILVYNPLPELQFRAVFSWIHRISGVSLIIIPPIAMYRSKHDFKDYVKNINQAWAWTLKDLKCLCLIALSYISKRVLKPDGARLESSLVKFNYAAAMLLVSTYPIFIVSGIFIWITDGLLLFWLIHFIFALMATLFLLGHMIISWLNPPYRVALSKKISDFVDRRYEKLDHGNK